MLWLSLLSLVIHLLIQAVSADKEVFAHFIVGNTYPYTVSDWQADIQEAVATGIDGFALNMGSDAWQVERIDDAFTAAASVSSSFKLFISFDMSVISADATFIEGVVRRFANKPNQFWYNGKIFVSTFAGEVDTFGYTDESSGWQNAIKEPLAEAGYPIFFAPSWTSLGTGALNLAVTDGFFSWNSWPTSSNDMNDNDDISYQQLANSLGKLYIAPVSPWFFTHLSYKNFVYKSDWLIMDRWQEMLDMQPDMIEVISWNDFGESHYMGSIRGALPAGSDVYVDGFDHKAWRYLMYPYIDAYKNGLSAPQVTFESLFYWYRPTSKYAVATSDSYGYPSGGDYMEDNIYVAVYLLDAAEVTITSGSNSQTFSGVAGVNRFSIAFETDTTPSFSVSRGGLVMASGTGPEITSSTASYNFNAYTGHLFF
ncbi:glucan endo-1,3-alpha-glucosidase Agn1 [Schizosaccharomyces japonicus yFS275]|uniref:Glucan endo-1,3-alpha-glucosidase Agn1 n=1 Tax=Schizosaccharomyces japonicus (strain yFS275 / FY16936) TaxID=402676 RepID=B6K491_SCHJY|nr:glucan endo-1,3-alpha-glucosidase Agn1 [Schizosaccharomyces japonicus yFS275]EEB08298.1 glucan endo-1,3-alpha-glucosidase Agn1 [Schizosaccharomyces japonicus yFS275]